MKLFKKKHKTVFPSIWKSGQLLCYSGIDGATDFEHGLCARTHGPKVCLEILLPGRCIVDFGTIVKSAVVSADFFELETEAAELKVAFFDAYNLLITGPCKVLNQSEEITVISNDNKTLLGSKGFIKPELLEQNVEVQIEANKSWLQQRLKAFGNKTHSANEPLVKALSILKAQIYSPQGRLKHYWSTPDRWPHRGMWLWDSAFHAIGWRHLDVEMARELIEAVLDVQRPDGMIPIMATPFESKDITQPPVLCMAAAAIHETQPDFQWLEKIYEPLCRYVQWDLDHRDSDGFGLVEWHIDHEDPNCPSGESGMDNSPRFDCAKALDAVDFNSYLAHECELLSKFALWLEKSDGSIYWNQRHKELCDKINQRLWNDQQGFYFDCHADTAEQTDIMSSAGFLPLLCGAADTAKAQKLAAHLENPKTFASAFAVPSIAANQQCYSKDMWRGPTWVNLNWMIAQGLERYGLKDAAFKIRNNTCRQIEKYYQKYGTFFEFYDDRCEVDPPELLRKGKNDPSIWVHQVIFDYGWTAGLYLDMLSSFREI